MLKVSKNAFVVLDLELNEEFWTVFALILFVFGLVLHRKGQMGFHEIVLQFRLEGPEEVSSTTSCSKQRQLQDHTVWPRYLPSLENFHKYRLLSLSGQPLPLHKC